MIHECLDAYLADTCDARLLRADGSYERVTPALAKQANGKSASKECRMASLFTRAGRQQVCRPSAH